MDTMIKSEMKPLALFTAISHEAGGNVGGTIRDGSDSEKFALGSICFNIQMARQMAGKESNSEIEVSPEWSAAINVSPSHALRGKSDNPVFVALLPTEQGTIPLLIDGHHRMYRAVHDEEDSLDAYTFTPEEVMTFIEAPPDIMAQLESNLAKQNNKTIGKQGPTGSDVHVNTTDLKKKPLTKTSPRVLEGGGLDGQYSGSNAMDGIYSMAQIVSGIDWELGDGGLSDVDDAKLKALSNLSDDPDFYRKKYLMQANSPDITMKDTEQQDDDPDLGVGINLDLGSGQAREPGYLGVDLYPYDHGTVVHDMEMGFPFLKDGSVQNVRMSNVPEVDPKIMMSEIQRVMMPGGQFVYEGPSEIYNYPPYMQLASKEKIDKTEGGQWTKHVFNRVAVPDAATSNDSEPRIGIAQYDMLPADALLAMDATGYYNSDGTSSGRGNRVHGYPSQGSLLNKKQPTTPKVRNLGIDNTGAVCKEYCPIFKSDQYKQIVYCVVLSPEETDLQDDIMSAEDIEKTAHDYLVNARVVGRVHRSKMDADVVESYIAPQDFNADGQFGPQVVKKGAWVIGIKVLDPMDWKKVLSGEYTGVSVGGMGTRIPL